MKVALLHPLTVTGLTAMIFHRVTAEATSESEGRDAASALPIEALGWVQSTLIGSGNQTRPQVAKSMADPVARHDVSELPSEKRNLRLGRLKRQLTEMTLAYHYSSQIDERETGVGMPAKVDPAATARNLSRFVLVGAALPGCATRRTHPTSLLVIWRRT